MLSRMDEELLRRTFELARNGDTVSVKPNPHVGAVIAKDHVSVAESYHAVYGGPHAEARALELAGPRSAGATVYCNLEPCSFHAPDKHNEPCTRKLIDAGVSRVVIAQLDPNPRVRGEGVRQLRKAGISVDIAEDMGAGAAFGAAEAWYTNARFNTYHSLGRPYVTIKLAQSLDGRIAAVSGDSKWISDEDARREVHELRAAHDAVMVGIGTVEADDPRLNVRLERDGGGAAPRTVARDGGFGVASNGGDAVSRTVARDGGRGAAAKGAGPRAVVIDTHARISGSSVLLQERAEELIVVAAAAPSSEPSESSELSALRSERISSLRRQGATVLEVPAGEIGGVDMSAALRALAGIGVQSVMVEGGAELATTLLRQRLFDALRVYVAPIVIGGDGGAIGALGVRRVADALRLEAVRQEAREGHMLVSGFREGWYRETRSKVDVGGVGSDDIGTNSIDPEGGSRTTGRDGIPRTTAATMQEDADVHRAG